MQLELPRDIECFHIAEVTEWKAGRGEEIGEEGGGVAGDIATSMPTENHVCCPFGF